MTGRLCYSLSDLFLLQWDEERRIYPKGIVIGSLL
jgi:beta-1,4-N-acetylglucosaminyltransferase